MLRLHQVTIALSEALALDEEALRNACAKYLRIAKEKVLSAKIVKRSVDARDKSDVHITLTVDAALAGVSEQTLAAKYKPNQVAIVAREEAEAPADVFHMAMKPWPKAQPRPIVVGAGPAGLFCALALAARGARPILLERGQPVGQRTADIELFQREGVLNPESNVLFGEGGAGAFSDGKLTCGLNSPRIRTVLETLSLFGAPREILTAQRPHIGTDELRKVLAALVEKLAALGAGIRFGHKLVGFLLKDGHIAGVQVAHDRTVEEFSANAVCLAIGHSARDTYKLLNDIGAPMQPKPFAVGVRIEQLQRDINKAQYGNAAGHPALPPAEYKLNVPTPDQRGVYTFCMCPGGRVIGAASEADGVNVNGMSLHARDGKNANAALLVGVRPEDYGSDDPLAGVAFQRGIERAAYAAAGGYKAPCQRVGDFLADRESKAFGEVSPTYLPGVSLGDVRCCLPDFVTQNLRAALPVLGRKLRGFDAPDALLTAPETRSSAPLRILRNERRESPITGLYPLGEGAGYAGGIVSAAIDGLCAGMELFAED